MHSLFTPVDTLDATTFLHSVVQSNSSFDLQWLMPVTGLANGGTPGELPSNYGLYLTISASGQLNTGAPPDYHTINVTLWADPNNDAGTGSSTVEHGVAFSGNTANDIALATGTIVSGTMTMDPVSQVRSATYVETLTPTFDGTLLLRGSIHQGDLLTEQFTTQPDEFQALPQQDGTTVDLVNGGTAMVTLSDPNGSADTFLLPQLPSDFFQHSVLRFLHH
jgi:hypothetical protein